MLDLGVIIKILLIKTFNSRFYPYIIFSYSSFFWSLLIVLIAKMLLQKHFGLVEIALNPSDPRKFTRKLKFGPDIPNNMRNH